MGTWTKTSTTAERLKEAMAAAKMKQADLARATGLGKGGISNYITGRYEPKSDIISKLARALNCSEMWLWGYDVPKERTDIQVKNDQLVIAISKMRADSDLANAVYDLIALPKEQFESIKQLLATLRQD